MISSFPYIPHIPAGYAGGRATHGAVAETLRARSFDFVFSSCLRGFMHCCFPLAKLGTLMNLVFYCFKANVGAEVDVIPVDAVG
jgi:hypothetical protein